MDEFNSLKQFTEGNRTLKDHSIEFVIETSVEPEMSVEESIKFHAERFSEWVEANKIKLDKK